MSRAVRVLLAAVLATVGLNSFAGTQLIIPNPTSSSLTPGSSLAIDVGYNTVAPADDGLSGLSFRIHWDSRRLNFVNLASVLATNLVAVTAPQLDDENFDGHDDMDDASFNDRGTTDSEPAGRPTYVDDGSPFPVQLARLLHDDKCTDIVLLDLRGVNPMWDYVIIGSGTSDRQMRSVLTHVAELGRLLGHEVYRRNVDDRAT